MDEQIILNPTRANIGLIITTLLLIIVLSGGPVFSQELTIESDQQFAFARQLYQKGQYHRAGEEYQRFAFFFPQDPRKQDALYFAADAYFNSREYDIALGILKDLSQKTPLDTVAVKAFFLMAECCLQKGTPSEALVQLHNLIVLSDNPDVHDRAFFRMGWIYIEQMDWTAARNAFNRIRAESPLPASELSAALTHSMTIPQKSPALAGTLSIIPGAGQLYCGRYQDALAAFLVNVGLIWAAVDAFDQEQYALGGLLAFVGGGFYTGNIYSAVSSAHKYNLRRKQQFIHQLKHNPEIGLGVSSLSTPGGTGLCLTLNVHF